MDNIQLINYLILIVSIILGASILLQARGSGLGTMFGGSSGSGEFYRSRRGIEKVLYYTTIIGAIILIALCFASVIIK